MTSKMPAPDWDKSKRPQLNDPVSGLGPRSLPDFYGRPWGKMPLNIFELLFAAAHWVEFSGRKLSPFEILDLAKFCYGGTATEFSGQSLFSRLYSPDDDKVEINVNCKAALNALTDEQKVRLGRRAKELYREFLDSNTHAKAQFNLLIGL